MPNTTNEPEQLRWPQGTPVMVTVPGGKALRTSIIGPPVNGRLPCGGVSGGVAPEDVKIDLMNLTDSPVAELFDEEGHLLPEPESAGNVADDVLSKTKNRRDQDDNTVPSWPSGTPVKHCVRDERGVTVGEPYWSQSPRGWFVRIKLYTGEAECLCEDWLPIAEDEPIIGKAQNDAKKDETVVVKQETVADVVTLPNGKTMTVGEIDAVIRKEAKLREMGQECASLYNEYLELNGHAREVHARWKEKAEQMAKLAGSDAQLSIFSQPGVGEPQDEDDPGQLNAYEEGAQARQKDVKVQHCPYDHTMPDRRANWQKGWKAEDDRQKAGKPQVMDTRPKSGAPDRLVDGEALELNADELNELFLQTEDMRWTEDPKAIPKLEGKAKTFELYGKPWMVVDYLTAEESKDVPTGQEAFELRPLWDAEEWGQLHPEAEPIETSTDPRFAEFEVDHGLHAGRRVKLGRRKLVIGTADDRLLVLFPMSEEPAASGKDAAAGEGKGDDPFA